MDFGQYTIVQLRQIAKKLNITNLSKLKEKSL